MPKVSVIMPVYNVEKYLKSAIQSILNQTFEDFELIIINDASTDNSEEVIQSFNDPRIKYIKNQINKGVSYSTNIAIDVALGKYIAKADSDDIYYHNRLQEQIQIFEKYPDINICSFDIELINAAGETIGEKRYNPNIEYMKAQFLFDSALANPTIMFNRDIFVENDIRYDINLRKAEDYDFFVSLNDEFRIYHISKILMKYRKHESSLSFNFDNIQKEANIVRKKVLEKIGLRPSKKEFELHQLLCGIQKNECNLNIDDLFDWLDKLIIANEKSKYCDYKILVDLLINKTSRVFEKIAINNYAIWDGFWENQLVQQSNLPELNIKLTKGKLDKNSKIAIFGTSRIGLYLYKKLIEQNYLVTAFIDNDLKKQNKTINSVKIISQNDLYNNNMIDIVLLSIHGNHDIEILNAINKNSNRKITVLSWKDLTI